MKFAGKWKELENIILSEVTQTQKEKHDDDSNEEKVFDLEPDLVQTDLVQTDLVQTDLVQTLAQFLHSHVALSKLFMLFESQHQFM
ncbi:hypothetical protein STEG23_034040 [Scotinomys teguina]